MDDIAQWQLSDRAQHLADLRGQKDDTEAKPLRFAMYCHKTTDDKEKKH